MKLRALPRKQRSPKCKAREKFFARHMVDMLTKYFFRNTATGMNYGFLGVPLFLIETQLIPSQNELGSSINQSLCNHDLQIAAAKFQALSYLKQGSSKLNFS